MAEVRDVSGDLDRFFLLVRNPVTEEWPSPEREWANAFLADCIGSDYLFDCYIKSIQEEKQDPTVPPDFTWIIRSALQDLKSLSVSDFVSLALCPSALKKFRSYVENLHPARRSLFWQHTRVRLIREAVRKEGVI